MKLTETVELFKKQAEEIMDDLDDGNEKPDFAIAAISGMLFGFCAEFAERIEAIEKQLDTRVKVE